MFESDEARSQPDWPLVQNGSVNLFQSKDEWRVAISNLGSLGYHTCLIDCRDNFSRNLSMALGWEAMFGYKYWNGNLNALLDGFRTIPDLFGKRVAIAFENYQIIARSEPEHARQVLDLFEKAARDHLLCNDVLIALVQTDDRTFRAEELGGRAANWN